MINRVTLVGRVGSKPEIKITTTESKMARLSLATSEKYKNKKGRLVYLEGQIETRSYDDQGTTKYVTEIVVPTFSGQFKMLDSKGGGSGKSTNITKEESEIDKADIPF